METFVLPKVLSLVWNAKFTHLFKNLDEVLPEVFESGQASLIKVELLKHSKEIINKSCDRIPDSCLD